MMIVYTKPYIRKLGIDDLDLLLKAQEKASHELDAMEVGEVALLLQAGRIEGLVLDAPDRKMLVSWQREGRNALLSVLYREGSPNGMSGDCRRLLDRTEGVLREFGVTNLFCAVNVQNSNFDRLLALYTHLGFGVDLVRMGKVI